MKFKYTPIYSKATSTSNANSKPTEYRLVSRDGVKVENLGSWGEVLIVESQAITKLIEEAVSDVSHLLRSSHLEKLQKIMSDPEASDNDRFVALDLLRNAVIAAQGEFPSCQDTGTAIVVAKKGERVFTGVDDKEAISEGIFNTFQKKNLRYSQMAPINFFEEKNTQNNLPAQVDIYSEPGSEYHFLVLAKGGGSANKSYLYQKTKAILNPQGFEAFAKEAIKSLGTAACPPYHLVLVVGGTSAEETLKVVKYASTGYLDDLPQSGNEGGQAFRDLEMEKLVEKWAQETGIGAQFGGKYLVHDVRVIRLPRHGASLPVGIGVSCSADRNIKAKITKEGLFLEQLELHPEQYLPVAGLNLGREQGYGNSKTSGAVIEAISLDLNRPIAENLALLARYPVATRVMLNGPMIVARDIAHSKLKERLDQGLELPDYFKNYAVYYAGPAKTPAGYASGSFGPTTSERMDPYVGLFQAKGASLLMLGKGNRSANVTEACRQYGGFYLGSIGGPAARLGKECITKVEVLDYKELGMEAVWKIEVKDFPAFIIIDSKGNDFFKTVIK